MRDLHHPHGQRDVVAPDPAREAPAVPALVQVREGLLDAEAEREPLGQHGADLAVAQGPVGQGFAHPRSPSQHLAGASQRPGVRVDVAQPGREEPGLRAEERGNHLAACRQLVAPDLGIEVRLGRAADVLKQGDVVHVLERSVVQRQLCADADGDKGCSQPVLERLTHGQIRREREHADQLGPPYARHRLHAAPPPPTGAGYRQRGLLA